jgi:hypothetical protein
VQRNATYSLSPLALVEGLDRAIGSGGYFASRVAGQPRALARPFSAPSLMRPRAIPRQRSRSRYLLWNLRACVRLGRLRCAPCVLRVVGRFPRGLIGALEGRAALC